MERKEDLYHLRNFEDLLYDAVHLLYLAHDVDPERDEHGYEFTYARSSVLNTLLLFECGANCCVDSLNLPKAFSEDIDRISFLSKYEFFLSRIRPEIAFDRGCRETQAVAELKAIRDAYVHPKVRKKEYSKEDAWGANFGIWPVLRFPKDLSHWSGEQAVAAMKAANDFFNLYFLTWCKFDTDTVCELLLGSDPAHIPAISSVTIDCVEGLSRAVQDYKIDFKFLGKRIHPNWTGSRNDNG
jgi:hypothetical protein